MNTATSTAPAARRFPSAFSGLFRKGAKAYDLLCAVPLMALYSFSAFGVLRAAYDKLALLDLARPDATLCLAILAKLGTATLMTLFIFMLLFRRPPVAGAKGPMARIAALAGTYLAILIPALPARELPAAALAVSAALTFGGIAFAVYSILYLGRSFSLMPEARRLVTGGPYARVRHPLYIGEELAMIGTSIQYISWLGALVLGAQICWQLYRMSFEEQVLAETFPCYAAYKARTARLIPGLY